MSRPALASRLPSLQQAVRVQNLVNNRDSNSGRSQMMTPGQRTAQGGGECMEDSSSQSGSERSSRPSAGPASPAGSDSETGSTCSEDAEDPGPEEAAPSLTGSGANLPPRPPLLGDRGFAWASLSAACTLTARKPQPGPNLGLSTDTHSPAPALLTT